ncbi:MAG TPA: hypothetical protein VFM46_13570, partial [Pseudomonadales bacterium]|nr:hypothetical protein [Pseudomonadales bacterium]
YELGEHASEYADNIDRASQKTGVATDKLQELSFAAHMADVSADSFTGAMQKFNVKVTEAAQKGGEAYNAFHAVGISMEDLKSKTPDELLLKVAQKFHETEDGATKTAVAIQLFGRAGAELIPMLNKGSTEIEQLKQKAHDLGLVMDGEALESAAKLDDQLKEMRSSFEGVRLAAGNALVPAMTQASKALEDFIVDARKSKESTMDLRVMFEGLGVGVSFVAQAFNYAGAAIGGTLAILGSHAGVDGARDMFEALGNQLDGINKRYEDLRNNLTSPPPDKPKTEGGGDQGGNDKPKGSIDYSDLTKSRVAEYEKALEARKNAIDREAEMDGSFRSMSLREEADYWQGIINAGGLSADERIAVEKKYYTASSSARKEQFAAHLTDLKNQMDATEKNYDDRLAIAQKMESEIANAF